MSRLARLVLLLAVMTVMTATVAYVPAAAAEERAPAAPAARPHPSRVTRSYYMGNGSGAAARNLGCLQGDKQGRMTLFFGAPTPVAGTYGATLWGAPNRTTAQVAATVREFIRGYVWCRQSTSYRLLVGIGTSNSAVDSKSSQWVYGHGRAWSSMVRSVGRWAARHYPAHVRVYGAWDAEPSWSQFLKAEQWMRGYSSVGGAPALHANNSADGCPQRSSENGSCNNGWNQYAVWRLSWRHDPALPIPQIYATSGANARQWHMIDAYGVRHYGDGPTFFGVMTQRGACGQTSSSCAGINASPSQAHDLLLWHLNTRPYTHQASLPGMTDIRWHS